MGTQFPLPQRDTAPAIFGRICCGQTAGWIKTALGMKVDLGPGHIVLDRDPAPPKRGHSPHHFSAHVYCGQTAGWIKVPLGTKVGLGPGNVVLDANSTPPQGAQSPIFGPCLLWPNGRRSQLLLSTYLHFACVVDDAKCILVTRVCVSMFLSVPRHIPALHYGPGCNLGNGRGAL